MKVGRPMAKWTPEMEQTLVDMKAGGTHFRDIATHLGVSVSSVEQRFQKIRRSKL